MRNAIVLVVLTAGSVGLASSEQPPKGETKTPDKDTIEELYKVLTAKEIWDKGFVPALRQLPAWDKLGQPHIVLFSTKVVGTKLYTDAKTAQASEADLAKGLANTPAFTPRALEAMGAGRDEKPKGDIKVVEFFTDDDSIRLSWVSEQRLFLKDLTIDQVYKQLGKPKATRKLVLRPEMCGRRPVALTLHSYANGLVTFAESTLSAKPGTVDRVILNVPVNSLLLFLKAKD